MSRGKSSFGQKVFLALFALPFAGVGVGMLWLAINTVTQSRRASEWEEMPCEILSVDLQSSRGSDSTTYKCVARYAYHYNGKRYESDRVSFSKGADNIGSFQRDCCNTIRSEKKRGTNVCRVNPEMPWEAVLFPAVRWGMIGFYMIFVLTFGGVGFGMLIFGVLGIKTKKKEDLDRLANPDQPWQWKPAWRDGIIKASDKVGMYAATGFALFWNAISFPIGFMAFTDGYLKQGEKGALVALLFPFVGVFMIVWAVYAILKYRKYGATTLQLASVPGIVGGKLGGIIHVPVHVVPETGFSVTLQCIHHYVTGSGKHRNTHNDVVWEDSRQLSTELLATDYSRTALPVLFAIPFDVQESSPDVGNDGIIWRVEAKAKTRGIDFSTKFDVPVFRTAESRKDFVLDDASVKDYEAEVSPEDLIAKLKLSVESTHHGLLYRFPAARHPGHALGLTLFFVGWTAAVVAMLKFGAPTIFPVIFGLIDGLVFWGLLDAWLISSRVAIDGRVITVTRGVLGIAPAKIIQRKDVEDVVTTKTSQSGQTVFYAVKLLTDTGKHIMLGNGLVGRKDAEDLAVRIKADVFSE
ncbi:MAG: DUF3592 domain-containing protein [Verrucomicrobia bacterium]|jgi:hypothetical protein|nr:DUF3592 domain-containing protein [Verrucomicrobiota bacterium]